MTLLLSQPVIKPAPIKPAPRRNPAKAVVM